MKCPKCGYLGFESGDRCRNCSYDFSLAPAPSELDFTLDRGAEQLAPALDLNRIIGASEPSSAAADLPLFPPSHAEVSQPEASAGRAEALGRGSHRADDDAPLIATLTRPRAPLGVRRATPEVPRARVRMPRPSASASSDDTLFQMPPVPATARSSETGEADEQSREPLASPLRRIMAGIVDVSLVLAVDGLVLYFTLRLCGLPPAEVFELPVLPLTAFFLLLNGGYFVAFTAIGGQSIGKMAFGIKVIGQEDGSVPIGRAALRTLAYLVSALPLGAGFLPGVMSADRLALHDRLAHTRVVRPST